MHPHDQRAPEQYWEDEQPPDPTVARTDAEFLAELRVQVEWSGLAHREIEYRASAYGEYIPEGAVTELLHGNVLPTEDLLVYILWALGCDDETVELWVWARGQLAAAAAQFNPAEVSWVEQDERKTYSGGALASAVKDRGEQSGWRGLHRRTPTDDAETTKHIPKRAAGSKGSGGSRGTAPMRSARPRHDDEDEGRRLSPRIIIAAAVGGVVALGAGVAFALSGGEETQSPPGAQANPPCCAASPSAETASEGPGGILLPTDMATPGPVVTTKTTSPTSRTTTRQPTPAQTTQGPAPRLTGSGNAAPCAPDGGNWIVAVTVTANLANATSGTNPSGRAGVGSPSGSFTVSGEGTVFSGTARVNVGSASEAASGTIRWEVTVNVPGGSQVSASGNDDFSCVPPTP